MEETNQFKAYEYMDVHAKSDKAEFLIDAYRNFGWELTDKSTSIAAVKLNFKRNYKTVSREEIVKLQSKFDNACADIEKLEKSAGECATVWGLVTGVAGTAFMGGAVFAYLAAGYLLCGILAIPGFLGWGLSYFAYKKIKKSKQIKSQQKIAELNNVRYKCCEEAFVKINA